ncbi:MULTISPECIES: 16S rRNA (guanine(966)-N(2))-methyltransferase RsmD [unclassified Oceanobacter]|uniref:16S rRNA (guanine(966)-N(2))-methyltransferase RsmD n=1 Tax=unclassified Oceanobacter TaxID=2620260 RepID=UPI002734A9DF|nr:MULTISPECIES: 16S rRNA (guanine(966)-N(2))-methyltransferase RsmD [unclassified Oceanobacter]MDP2504691.1 16S rRNA (guanine(966)-N(2))-methyltransferase RsmD [Oceanobacter sp. 3_MG-2023]MDP2546851.1 16S rRNA (guanine(966)-N(2))-methyltransferase RsmD [Oceanobacter sp. 4_MG-2023]MDP2607678.1 16S rRNA (guanine(966)-N(2))-methyltransferase RsmD [Oceanobacter sp. 1_MG-2023]MDP2611138.1 16S rRNA (guanine(966)-N(2))-methyltransferase RsmD [Oceanobacter sp. 2_MG-2023]
MSKLPTQQLRIIGGEWRSRRLRFVAVDGLRPTMDRVRETIFNWLQFDVEGARVLDAFAGSGALGIEALSRGAREVVFLEKHPKVALQIKDNLSVLNALNAQVWAGDALAWLQQNPQPFDLVFLDPPFGKQLLQPAIDALTLLPGTLVYIEHEAALQPTWPSHWQERKSKTTKEFCFRLFIVSD